MSCALCSVSCILHVLHILQSNSLPLLEPLVPVFPFPFPYSLLVVTGMVTLQRRDDVSGILWYKRVLPVGLAHAGAGRCMCAYACVWGGGGGACVYSYSTVRAARLLRGTIY